MSKNKKSSLENLFYNNKFLMIFSVVVAIIVWANVKVTYSEEVTRTINDIEVNIASNISLPEGFEAFCDKEDLFVDIEVKGKAYNINQRALTKDDIVIEPVGSYVDSAGYKVLNLTAKVSEASDATDVNITKVSPSSITVYFDRKDTREINVSAELENDKETLQSEGFELGNPVPSMPTVEVTGPVTILNKLELVVFRGKINEADLPLTADKEVHAEIAFELDRASESKYLSCVGINDESNPATVTVPVFVSTELETSVKFINQPAIYNEEAPKYTVYPSKVNIRYNSKEEEKLTFPVGTVDFKNVSNKVNYFEFPVDENMGVNIVDKTIEKFTVTMDMSHLSSLTLEKTPGKIVLVKQDENYTYTVNYEKSELNAITVIGPKESLDKITEEDIQIEINVSSMSLARSNEQLVEVSNISIASEEFSDCWVYGKYNAYISVEPKE